MSDPIIDTTEAVAKACLKTARKAAKDMYDAVERQQERQQAHLAETAKLIESLLRAGKS